MPKVSTGSLFAGCLTTRFAGNARCPKYLSSDHDPLYRFERWQANLRILEVTEIKTVPYVPLSHPFVERAGRHDSTRVFGSHVVLDHCGSRKQAARFQEILQPSSLAYCPERANI